MLCLGYLVFTSAGVPRERPSFYVGCTQVFNSPMPCYPSLHLQAASNRPHVVTVHMNFAHHISPLHDVDVEPILLSIGSLRGAKKALFIHLQGQTFNTQHIRCSLAHHPPYVRVDVLRHNFVGFTNDRPDEMGA